MLNRISSGLIGLSRSIGELAGYELHVILTDHKIKLGMTSPEKAEKDGFAWDHSQYVSGNIHHEDFANSVKVTVDEDSEDVDVITSERYQKFMKQSLVDDIISESTKSDGLSVFHAMLIIVAVQVTLTSVLAFLVI